MDSGFSNLTSGGQIFLHQIRMFKQVAAKAIGVALLLALLTSSVLLYAKFEAINWHPTLTYYRGLIEYQVDHGVDILFPGKPVSKIDISDNSRWPKLVPLDIFVKDQYFIDRGKQLEALLMTFAVYSALGVVGFLVIIASIWGRIGQGAKATQYLNGSQVLNAKEITSYLRKHKKASDLQVASMPLVKDSETKHILITGANGSGKTNYLHELLPQIRKRKEPALVIDLEGTMVARYYRPGYDILLNPHDQRSHGWDFWREVENISDLEAIAHSLFNSAGNERSEVGKLFADWSADLFVNCVQKTRNEEPATRSKKLFAMLHTDSPQSLMKRLRGTSAATIMDFSNDKNITAHNVRSTTMSHTKWLDLIDDNIEHKICFKDYFSNLDKQGDRWIFLTAQTKNAKVLLPLISLILDVAVMSLTEQGEDLKRRYWFVMDELASLNRLPALEQYITRLRKYGGCVLAATQSFKQFYTKYGRDAGSIMLSQFNTNIVCRINDPDEAGSIIKQIGNIEYSKKQKNISFGAHEHRDGESYTEQEKTKPLVNINDFKLLDPFEAYILLPEARVSIGKIKAKLQALPEHLEQFFIAKKL